MGCSLRVVGRLLRDMERLPGNATDFSESSLTSFFTPSGREGKKEICFCFSFCEE
jgi:hypothetical protein